MSIAIATKSINHGYDPGKQVKFIPTISTASGKTLAFNLRYLKGLNQTVVLSLYLYRQKSPLNDQLITLNSGEIHWYISTAGYLPMVILPSQNE